MKTIVIEKVDLPLLNNQRKELHTLLLKNPDTSNGTEEHPLWGLLEMLDYICDKYEEFIYIEKTGEEE